MKLNIQTMKNVKYSVECNETDTVLDVKKSLQQQHQLGDPDELKLIHVGKILKDEQTLDSAKVKNNDLIVIMVSKKKTAAPKPAEAAPVAATSAPAAAASSSSPATAATSATAAPSVAPAAATSSPAPTASTTTPAASPAPAAAAASAAPASSAASATSALLTGTAYEEAVTNLMSFGFPHDQVVRALRAAFNNADRAAEYLFSGIPASALAAADAEDRRANQPAAGAAAAAASPAANTSASAAATTTASSPASTASPAAAAGQPPAVDLSSLGDLAQLRTVIAANPGMLPALISQLAQNNPQLVQQLEDNPQAFLQLMQSLGVDPSQLGGSGQLPAELGGSGGGGGGGRTVIQITEEEKSQLDNLASLGFPRDIALEAWLLCDRNQELAAAYLLEHGGDIAMEDDAGGMGGYGGDMGGGGGGGGDDEDDDINPEDYME